MASKGQRFKRYDLEFKLKVLKEYKEGISSGYLAQKYKVPEGTIKTWGQISKRYGTLGVSIKGRPTGKMDKDFKERYKILKKFQDFLVIQEQKKK